MAQCRRRRSPGSGYDAVCPDSTSSLPLSLSPWRAAPFRRLWFTTQPPACHANCFHFELRNCRKCFSIFRFPRTSLGFSYCIIDCGCASCKNTEQTALSPPRSFRTSQLLCTFSICIQIQMHFGMH